MKPIECTLIRLIKVTGILCMITLFGCLTPIGDMEYIPTSTITLTDSIQTIRFSLRSETEQLKLSDDCTYYWFEANKIHRTQAGYSGKLLNGFFVRYDLSGNLLEKGLFKNGLKEGIWKEWHPDGNIKSIVSWEDGIREGPIYNYNPAGYLTSEYQFKNDQLNGQAILFNDSGKMRLTIKYRDDQLIDTIYGSFFYRLFQQGDKVDKSPQKSPDTISVKSKE